MIVTEEAEGGPLPPLPEKPLVSVIVPSYNQGQFIRDTIDSILSQDYRPLEILVIDGDSTDNTITVLESFRNIPELRWWSEPDSGVVEAVNKGFARARGEIAGIQSSDDCYLLGAISKCVDIMISAPEVGLVYGHAIKVDEHGNELARHRSAEYTLENLLTRRTNILQPSAFFRLSLARSLGGWDERYFNCDTHLWYRMAFRTKIRKTEDFLSKRRMHGEQRDTQREKIVESHWRMIDELKELRSAPSRVRRAAICGKFIHAIRYNPTGSLWADTNHAWRAAIAYPKIICYGNLVPMLVPGYRPIRVWASTLKKRIMGGAAPSK